MTFPHESINLPRSLGEGLVLRLATPADTEALAVFNARLLAHGPEGPILDYWTRALMSGRHPTTIPADFVVVEDTRTAQIVSATVLMRAVWKYEDIPFPVGRPELVATDPAYRRRGLVRVVFGAIHELSAAYGHLVQGITGISWFYRQFGYEYALSLGGSRELTLSEVPELKADEAEPYQVRPATEADIPSLMRLHQRQCAGRLVTPVVDEARWRYDLFGCLPESNQATRPYCIDDGEGNVVGYYVALTILWESRLRVREIGVAEGVSLRAVLPSTLRALKRQAEAYAAQSQDKPVTPTAINFALGPAHPLYEALNHQLKPLKRLYAWYIRVPDLPAFIRHIGPVLERRLASSMMSGFSGDLKLTFYRGGLRMAFQGGKLIEAADWTAPDSHDWEGAGFPPLVFLQLLFGYRSLEELRYAFPDCSADEEPGLLLNALFPKQLSWLVDSDP